LLSRLLLPVLLIAGSGAAHAAASINTKPLTTTEKNIETLGTGVSIALPLTAAGITLWKGDRVGSAQLVVETILTVGTAYALKNIVHEERPNGADEQSFPSGTTALAASGSSFLWGRYGWEYGLPAFAATQFVSYSRVQAREHHWYDTLASSGIAAGYGYVLTTPFKKRFGVDTSLSPMPGGAFLHFAYAF
ncbi:MAG TPA: phosphatase PAP2 family protein, partial [Rhizomicrobium sp.]|nr:phosphatase PAP2 family protein [Rhizomicrobium sp.]